MERSLHTLALLGGALGRTTPGGEGAVLEAVLEVADSSMTYRRRYMSSLQTAAVLDLLLSDESNPRSLAFQLVALADDVDKLPREMDLPGNASAGANGALRKVTSNRYSTDLFLIRAGSGMWAARIIDGGTGDDDHVTNGRVSTDISVLTPFGGTSAEVPDKFAKGDILFFVDRNTLEFAVASQGNC